MIRAIVTAGSVGVTQALGGRGATVASVGAPGSGSHGSVGRNAHFGGPPRVGSWTQQESIGNWLTGSDTPTVPEFWGGFAQTASGGRLQGGGGVAGYNQGGGGLTSSAAGESDDGPH